MVAGVRPLTPEIRTTARSVTGSAPTILARWVDPSVSTLYLEVIFLLECLAPGTMHIDRFLPPTPLRVVVDHRGQDVTASVPTDALTSPTGLAGAGDAFGDRLDALLHQSHRLLAESADRAAQHGLLDFLVQLTPGRRQVELEVACERGQQLLVVLVQALALARPGDDDALFDRKRWIAKHELVVDRHAGAKPRAGRAGPERRVERERSRLNLGELHRVLVRA